MKNRIFIFGAGGRMGLEIAADIRARQGRGQILEQVQSLEDSPEVVIDFSSAAGAAEAAQWCMQNKTPLVTGSTGLSPAQHDAVKKCARVVPTLQSPNMSLGINALAASMAQFAKHFRSGEIALEEIHHKHKKDQPSGTAKFLRAGLEKSAAQFVIAEPVSLRGGEIFGIHKVFFFLEGEWVSFEHHATDRAVFARGAVEAALWTLRQKPGLYSMDDFLRDEPAR